MTPFKNTIVSVTLIATALITALSVTIQPANGEAIFRDPASAQAPIVSPSLDLLTLNVAHGRGTALNQILVSETQHRQNLDDIASIVISSNAHAVALQEADAPSLWSGEFDHVEFLAEATGYPFAVHGHHADSWPYTYGAALLSRFKMDDTLSHSFRPSWPTAGKGFVRASIQWSPNGDIENSQSVTLVSVHLDFSREKVREQQIAELVDDIDQLTTPLIILGDFNADWSTEDSPVRVLAEALNLRAFRPTSDQFGTYEGSKRLDWILISKELNFIDYTVLPDIVSDHLAVVARIGWGAKE
jgi:endonuclease/exonuclease/phosphatase family metal-dependent hydrolase